jgi:hypothetical protein
MSKRYAAKRIGEKLGSPSEMNMNAMPQIAPRNRRRARLRPARRSAT